MKRLVQVDPETYKPAGVVCTFELVGDKVEVVPADGLDRWRNVAELVLGSEILTPSDGKAYYDALGSIRGSYFFVEEVPETEATK
jgi:hypothetical protein